MAHLDDIPQATRDLPLTPGAGQSLPWYRRSKLLGKLLGLVLLAIAVTSFVVWLQASRVSSTVFVAPFQTMVNPGALSDIEGETPSDRDRAVQWAPSSRFLLGHRAHQEAPEDDLVSLSANRSIRLRPAAAREFEAMTQAAAAASIRLVPLSGYRSHAEQETIFFSLRAQRRQTPETRAEVSAPPGYSEHHTGYAIDVGDANQPNTHLNTSFADTSAYAWLEENAVRFGFELSFPPDNFQGVAFEPWHWRYVGDRHSLETFYGD
ncbi:M15 family metallopeptidase [Nodosilinea sp. P-1105]|uniref:M15 family metallopeptidase n=1 Tax=Nodosilinea sp. P-1105 TaxID=2546229 RepID=UPI00146CB3D3|nr:M15 family metallopeptidase [Nodosilinea sp. P-1105]NMF81905.1 D-alanyl-D-alanine carboxypeptidase family protein [Nodosilinea sp. P-1105]